MSTDQFEPNEIVRIRLAVDVGYGSVRIVWSPPIPRHVAERAVVVGGPEYLAIEYGRGDRVMSAAIVRWTYN